MNLTTAEIRDLRPGDVLFECDMGMNLEEAAALFGCDFWEAGG